MTENTFDLNWIQCLMCELKEKNKREVFHNERDFQMELARLLWGKTEVRPRLEFPYPPMKQQNKRPSQNKMHKKKKEEKNKRGGYMDIWLPRERVAIELKYYTRKFELPACQERESFSLSNQQARNQRRYDFLDDVCRLESFRGIPGECNAGFAILLTNDAGYWEPPEERYKNSTDQDFRLYQGRKLPKKWLKWQGEPAEGTTKGRTEELRINVADTLNWSPYSDLKVETQPSVFKYLVIKINP